jgi:hypothetical protein
VSVHVDEVQTRVVPAPPSGEEANQRANQPRPGAAEEAWAARYRLIRRDGCRTTAWDFDD